MKVNLRKSLVHYKLRWYTNSEEDLGVIDKALVYAQCLGSVIALSPSIKLIMKNSFSRVIFEEQSKRNKGKINVDICKKYGIKEEIMHFFS